MRHLRCVLKIIDLLIQYHRVPSSNTSLLQVLSTRKVLDKTRPPLDSLTQANLTLTGSLRNHPTQMLA